MTDQKIESTEVAATPVEVKAVVEAGALKAAPAQIESKDA